MHKLLALMAVAPLLLAGCAVTSEAPGPGTGGDPFANQGGSDTPPVDNGAGVPAGDVDCASITQEQLLTFGYGIQTLAQLNTQSTVTAVNSGRIDFSPEEFADSVTALRTLEGHGVDPYGDPAEALDYYEDLNTAAINLLAYDTPVPEAEFTAYASAIGDSQQALNQQSAISASYNAYCTG